MEKKKLFISQPMKGKTEEEIRKERENAVISAKEILKEEVAVIDSYIAEDPPKNADMALWCLGRSLTMMSEADIVCFAKDGQRREDARSSMNVRCSMGKNCLNCSEEDEHEF